MSTITKKPALSSNLLVTTPVKPEELSPALQAAIEEAIQQKIRGVRETVGHRSKTLTVKAEPDIYKRLCRARFETDKSGQEIFMEALDLWFKKHKF